MDFWIDAQVNGKDRHGWKGQIDRKDGRKEMIDGYKVYIYGRDRWIDGQKGLNDRWIQRIYIYGRDR